MTTKKVKYKIISEKELEEIDRNARAYGFEIGRGANFEEIISTSPDNPFMDNNWKNHLS